VISVAGLGAVNFKEKYPPKEEFASVKATFWSTSVVRQAEWKGYINPTCNKIAGERLLK
jgi:hypothetical protein